MDPQNNNQPPTSPQPPVQPPQPYGPYQQPQQPMQPQPVQSFQPVAPQPPQPFQPQAQPYGGFAPQPATGGPKKGLLIGLIAGGIGLLLVIIIAVIAVSTMGVSKDDYKDASTTMQEVKTAYNKFGSVFIGSYSTEAEVKNGLDTIKNSREDFNTKYEELGKLKAIKNDKDVNKLYKALEDKKPKFDQAVEAEVEAYEKIVPAVSSFDTYSSSDSASKITAFKNKLEAIDGLKDENNKSFIDKMTTLLSKYATLSKKVQAGRSDYRKYDSQAVSEFYDTSTDISHAIRDWQSNLLKLADDGELKDELNALDDKLYDKATKNN